MHLEPVIGLEIHVQLKTKSKMFCSSDNAGENEPPNTTVCPICMGHPGTLPVLNSEALRLGILAGLALHCEIPPFSKFDRKNYFYPDLPKGYQISQYDEPVCGKGYLDIDIPGAQAHERKSARIGITRAHLEEDAAKLHHAPDKKLSYVDFNRAGTPLLEIVTEPDFFSPLEARIFLQELRLIMRTLGCSNADMEKGHMRADANISLREVIDDPAKEHDFVSRLNPKTEIKNINSPGAVMRALEYEIQRQTKLWEEQGEAPQVQSTRGWDENTGTTVLQRVKEDAHDYRYFPEPDLPPIEPQALAEKLYHELPELPRARRVRFQDMYGVGSEDARSLIEEKELADYFEKIVSELRAWLISLETVEGTEKEIWEKNKPKLVKTVTGWLLSKLGGLMAENGIHWKTLRINPEHFAHFIALLYQSKINSAAGQQILEKMLLTGIDPEQAMSEGGLEQVSDLDMIEKISRKVISENPDAVKNFQAGKENSIKFLVGQVMKESRGKANPQMAEELLRKNLSS